MTNLSVNINKIAVIRNSRGGNVPNVVEAARNIESWGANGITVHPRPDQRHIRYSDVRDLRAVVRTELNIEGNPIDAFCQIVSETLPDQVTLVPDAHDAITSSAGWDTVSNRDFLTDRVAFFKKLGIRVSVFVGADPRMVEGAAACGADRVELYTEPYASMFPSDPKRAVRPFVLAADAARQAGLGLNAGHDLSLENLGYILKSIPFIDEVSIGHALISEALYLGLQDTVSRYLRVIDEAMHRPF